MAKKSMGLPKRAVKKLLSLSSLGTHPYIHVPYSLIDHKKEYQKAYDAFLKPHWNNVVRQLEEGQYVHLLSMLKRLRKKRKRAAEKRERLQQEVNQFQMLFRALQHEAQAHGTESSLLESLGSTPQSSMPEWWAWASYGVIDDDEPEEGSYVLQPSDVFMRSFDAEAIPDPYTFLDATTTWGKLIDNVAREGQVEQKLLRRYAGLLKILDFRQSLIEAVLWEYEVLGHVSEYSDKDRSAHFRAHPDSFVLEFIKKGIELFDKKGSQYYNREGLITATIKAMELHANTDSRRMREKLERAGLYEIAKQGRPRKFNEEPLLVDMVDLWREAIEKGEKEKKGGE